MNVMPAINQWGVSALIMLALTLSGGAELPPTTESTAEPAGVPRPAPVVLAPPAGATNAAGRPSPFSAEISSDFIKKVMETSAKIEEAKREIAERQVKLYATNSQIKAYRTRMIELQKEINTILDADKELAELKMNRDLLWSTMPAMPRGREGGGRLPRPTGR